MGINIQRNLFAHKRPFIMLDYHTCMINLDCASHQGVHANAPKVLQQLGTSTHVRNSRSSHLGIHIAHLNATCRFSNQISGWSRNVLLRLTRRRGTRSTTIPSQCLYPASVSWETQTRGKKKDVFFPASHFFNASPSRPPLFLLIPQSYFISSTLCLSGT